MSSTSAGDRRGRDEPLALTVGDLLNWVLLGVGSAPSEEMVLAWRQMSRRSARRARRSVRQGRAADTPEEAKLSVGLARGIQTTGRRPAFTLVALGTALVTLVGLVASLRRGRITTGTLLIVGMAGALVAFVAILRRRIHVRAQASESANLAFLKKSGWPAPPIATPARVPRHVLAVGALVYGLTVGATTVVLLTASHPHSSENMIARGIGPAVGSTLALVWMVRGFASSQRREPVGVVDRNEQQ